MKLQMLVEQVVYMVKATSPSGYQLIDRGTHWQISRPSQDPNSVVRNEVVATGSRQYVMKIWEQYKTR